MSESIEEQIIKDIDYIMDAYCTMFSKTLINFNKKMVRRIKASNQLKEYLERIGNTEANPLIKKIYDIIGIDSNDELVYNIYYSIYKRNYKKANKTRHAFKNNKATFNQTTGNWDYVGNAIIPEVDEVVYGYPPLLEWIYINEVKSGDTDLLSYYVNKRYATKEDLR